MIGKIQDASVLVLEDMQVHRSAPSKTNQDLPAHAARAAYAALTEVSAVPAIPR